MKPYLDDPDFTKPCECGCGQQISALDARGRPRRFGRGHNLRVDHPRDRPGFVPSFLGRKHTPEARAKLSVAASRPKPWLRGERNGMAGRTGRANPNYKDGSSPERQRLYASAEWRALLRKVKRRDNYTCQECGSPNAGPRSLHVHHVKPWGTHPELRFAAANLVTLCRDCHHAAHRKGGDAE